MLQIAFDKFVLKNGLTVILHPDRSSPLVAVDLWYHVGSKDESPGRTGFAHLFEHLMFMGSRNAPYPAFDSIMESWGGHNNGTTSNDRTNYYEIGPRNLLETFLWLEADRLATLPDVITQEELERQRLKIEHDEAGELMSMEGLAGKLGYYECLGDYRLSDTLNARLRAVTAAVWIFCRCPALSGGIPSDRACITCAKALIVMIGCCRSCARLPAKACRSRLASCSSPSAFSSESSVC